MEVTNDIATIQHQVLSGSCMVQIGEKSSEVILLRAVKNNHRDVNIPEVEFSVVGPKEAFIESLDVNLNLVRRRLPIPELRVEEITVGKITKTKIAILSIEGITNKENVNTLKQRINDIEIDSVIDSSYIVQLISDNQHSPFPQFIDTERPDRIAAVLGEGKVAFWLTVLRMALLVQRHLLSFLSI